MLQYRTRSILWLFAALLVLVTACAPSAGRPVEEFIATPEDVIGEIAAFGVTLQPGEQMNFFSIDSIGDRFITLTSQSTTGFSLFFGEAQTDLTFSATQRGDVTLLASSGNGANAEDMLDMIILHLHSVFDSPPTR